MKDVSADVTRLLLQWRKGDEQALQHLIPLVYGELRKLAAGMFRRELRAHSLQPTVLVHEAYLRLVRQDFPDWKDRTHFYGIAARLMREILVDHARKQGARKRGGGATKVPLQEAIHSVSRQPLDLIAIDEAMSRLAEIDPRKCRALELRYFAGLSMKETAEALDISVATLTRDLRMAESWIRREIHR